MKTLPTCMCVLGLTAAASAGSLIDHIGAMDGSDLVAGNLFANQIFEAAYSQYSTVCIDDFDNGSGSTASAVSLIVGGWGAAYTGIDGIQALSANFYDSPEAAGTNLVGYTSVDVVGAPTASPDWTGPDTALLTVEGSFSVNGGMAYVGLIPTNEFATNGQTGAGVSALGDGIGWQCNPGEGFGQGPWWATTNSIAIRVSGGGTPSDPCEADLREAPCNADANFDDIVNVEDLLAVIGTFGNSGDGTSRPVGDVAPLPTGDCLVNVEDVLAVIGAFGADCTPVVPTGGCCNDDGSCTIETQDNCSGSYLGDDSDCSACVAGACCAGDGSCSEVIESACSGSFVGGSCADAGCQPVAGACCIPDPLGGPPSCIDDLDQATCDAFGGTLIDGMTCTDSPCGVNNDTCATATAVDAGTHAFDTTEATDSGFGAPDDSQCAGTYLDWGASPDVWFNVSAPSDGLMTISLCDAASYDTSLVLYEGADCNSLAQVACNGDTAVETGCQAYYSGIYDHPITDGGTYYIRIGGWNGAAGPGNMTIDIVGGNTEGACCVAGGCVGENTFGDCEALGGLWNNGMTCADVSCPQPYIAGGCDEDEADQGCVCFVDGDDAETDCNGGLNNVVPTYTTLTLGSSMCGTSSVWLDGPTGGQYRDLDWWHNADINAGGTFTFSIGSNHVDVCMVLNEDTGAVDYAVGNIPGFGAADTIALPAGNWCVISGSTDWNVGVFCGSGLDTYTLLVE